uniref:GTF2I repeat domain containing 2B n=1 Tax=Loxodonta africana TaxID=9785 RepID=G3TAN3_LOXAF
MAQVAMSTLPVGGEESSESRMVVTFLVSALESMCKELAKSKAEVACIAMYETDLFVVGTEKGRAFVNARTDFQKDFAKYCSLEEGLAGGLQEVKPLGAENRPQAVSGETEILRKAVEDYFCFCYGKALGTTAMIPVPYEKMLRHQSAMVVQGLPEGIAFKHPENYDLATLKRILENKAGISFIINRPFLDPADQRGSHVTVTDAERAAKSPGESCGPIRVKTEPMEMSGISLKAAAVSVKKESEDANYYQCNLQGNAHLHDSHLIVTMQVKQGADDNSYQIHRLLNTHQPCPPTLPSPTSAGLVNLSLAFFEETSSCILEGCSQAYKTPDATYQPAFTSNAPYSCVFLSVVISLVKLCSLHPHAVFPFPSPQLTGVNCLENAFRLCRLRVKFRLGKGELLKSTQDQLQIRPLGSITAHKPLPTDRWRQCMKANTCEKLRKVPGAWGAPSDVRTNLSGPPAPIQPTHLGPRGAPRTPMSPLTPMASAPGAGGCTVQALARRILPGLTRGARTEECQDRSGFLLDDTWNDLVTKQRKESDHLFEFLFSRVKELYILAPKPFCVFLEVRNVLQRAGLRLSFFFSSFSGLGTPSLTFFESGGNKSFQGERERERITYESPWGCQQEERRTINQNSTQLVPSETSEEAEAEVKVEGKLNPVRFAPPSKTVEAAWSHTSKSVLLPASRRRQFSFELLKDNIITRKTCLVIIYNRRSGCSLIFELCVILTFSLYHSFRPQFSAANARGSLVGRRGSTFNLLLIPKLTVNFFKIVLKITRPLLMEVASVHVPSCLGTPVEVLGGNSNSSTVTSSAAGVEDLNIVQVTVPDNEKERLSSAEKIKQLREQVSELFSRKFGEAIGVNFPVKVPYRKITFNPGCVVVDGMPAGVAFKAPGYLEISSMRRILDAAECIKFTVVR